MRRRRLAVLYLLVPLLLVTAYGAWPLASALRFHAAVERGDTDALRHMADWPRVRSSLKASLQERFGRGEATVQATSAPATAPKDTSARDTAMRQEPGLWQRFKTRYAQSVIERTVEGYVTPEGLPKLFAYRKTYNEDVRPSVGLAAPVSALSGTWLAGGAIDTAVTGAARLKSYAFEGPTDVALEIRDRYEARRSYRLTFQLRGWSWYLTGISVLGAIEAGI